MGEKLIDDLARALVQPMPRRRALRVLGSTLVAVAVPGMRPGPAFARRRATCDAGCGPDVRACPKVVNLGTGPPLCCGAPARRYSCEGSIFEPVCVDRCKGPNDIPCTGKKDQDGCSAFTCCKRPEFKGCDDGDCIPNCGWPAGSCKRTCGKTCCERGEICNNGKCVGCGFNAQPCGSGDCKETRCCKTGTRCCFNQGSTACCGPDQTCKAQGVKQAVCKCKPGKGRTCGSDCCADDEYCFSTIIADVPAPVDRTARYQRCRKRCPSPCGKNCCGTGYRCKKGRCVLDR